MVEKRSIRRRLIQFTAMLVYNADVSRWFSGKISHSSAKNICVPGLNCYSCPGAIASCPLGGLQNAIAGGRIPFFITGFLMLVGALLGRMVCAFLCPVGLVQELLYKIPSWKIRKTPKSMRITRKASLAKYIMLGVFCVVVPFLLYLKDGYGSPVFCSLVCPAGTAEAGWPLVLMNKGLRSAAGRLFAWKTIAAIAFIFWAVCMYRPFCRFVCPLGAVYSFFNRIAVFGIHVDQSKCVHCGACTATCGMDTLVVNDRECIRCGECISRCKYDALHVGVRHL